MDIEITNRRDKALMDQEVIELAINHTGEATPSENDVRKKVAAELDLDPLTIAVDGIYSTSGSGVATGQVTVHPEPVIDELPEEEPDEDDAEAADEASAEDADEDEDAAEGSEEDEEASDEGAEDDEDAADEDDADEEDETEEET